MSTIIDINVTKIEPIVTITAEPNEYIVNINNGGGGGDFLPLAGGTMDEGADIFFDNGSKISEGAVDAGTGGNKGIALTCAVGYEWKFEAGEAYLTETTSGSIRLKQYALSIPTINDDVTKGFVVGSYWYLDNQISYYYQCTDITEGAAVWEQKYAELSLANVLNVQDRVLKEINDNPYTFNEEDAVKFLIFPKGATGQVLNLDDSSNIFNDYASIVLSVGEDTTFNAVGTTDVRLDNDNVTPISTFDLLAGDFVILKKLETATWILCVLRRGSNGVPYTGATQDVDLGEFGLLTGNIEFDTTPTNIPTNAGSMVWNDSDGTVDLKLKGGNVTLQIGQESVLRVVNKTATNINLLESNYQAVRVTGAQGQRLKVDLAQATTDALSAETIGLVTETINNNQEGFITTGGLVRNIDTTGSLQSETWADGDILYLSATTAGQITKVKPSAPNHLIVIGYVVSAHATQGSIFVKVDNGYELDELHNVKIATPTNNQALTYTSATDLWENKTIIQDSISDGVTTVAPSQNAVFDALALKQNNLKTFNTTQGIYYFEEFIGAINNTVVSSYNSVVSLLSGNGSITMNNVATSNRTNQQGVITHSTGTASTNYAGYNYGVNSLYRGTGAIILETYIIIPTLSTSGERFVTVFGEQNGANFMSPTNSISIVYDEGGVFLASGVTSNNWRCFTRAGSTITRTDTTVPVVDNQWYKLRINISADGLTITFFIDNVLVATHNTNVPLISTQLTLASYIMKSVGTTARTMQTDYFMYEEIFTNPR
jgi:hypothetical protein